MGLDRVPQLRRDQKTSVPAVATIILTTFVFIGAHLVNDFLRDREQEAVDAYARTIEIVDDPRTEEEKAPWPPPAPPAPPPPVVFTEPDDIEMPTFQGFADQPAPALPDSRALRDQLRNDWANRREDPVSPQPDLTTPDTGDASTPTPPPDDE